MSAVMKVSVAVISVTCFLLILIYSNTFQAEFHFDDFPNIVNNPKDHLYTLSLTGLKQVVLQSRPLAHLSFAMNYYYGQLNVLGYHGVNLFLHIATALSLYFLVLLTLRLPGVTGHYGQVHPRVAIVASLLWAVHPVQTQAVNLIVQRMTLMATLLSLWSLLCYVQARSIEGRKRIVLYFLSLAAMILGLGSKENVVILPLLIILYEVYLISNFKWNVLRRSIFLSVPYLFLVIFFIGIFYLGLKPGLWETVKTLLTSKHMEGPYTLSWGERFLTECRIMIYYLSLLIFPHPARLNLDYDFPISSSILDPMTTLPSLLFVMGSILFALSMARRLPIVSFSILWFYGNLAIESVFFKLDLIYEHRLYAPSMALMVLVAAGVEHLWSWDPSTLNRRWGAVFGGIGLIMVATLCLWTYERNGVWRTGETLWEDTVKKSPGRARAHNSLAHSYIRQGKFELALKETQEALRLRPDYPEARVFLGYLYQKRGDLDLALQEYQSVLRDHPHWYTALISLGMIYHEKGQLDQAIEVLHQAIHSNPGRHQAHYLLGSIYASKGQNLLAIQEYEETIRLYPPFTPSYHQLAEIHASQGQFQKAIEIYKAAIALNLDSREFQDKLEATVRKAGQSIPQVTGEDQTVTGRELSSPQTQYELALAYHREGRLSEAIQHYRESLRLNPSAAVSYYQLGLALYQIGQAGEAIRAYQAAAERDSRMEGLHFNLGLALQKIGRLEEARDAYEQAIRINPKHFKAYYNLASIYQRLEMMDQAVEAYQQCLRLDPAHSEAHNNLGVLYAGQGRLDEALGEFRIAILNRPDYIQARYNLARAFQLTGRKEQAIVEYEKLLAYKTAGGARNPYQEQARVELEMLKATKP